MLADVDDLASFMQKTFTGDQEATGALVLEMASALVEGHLGRRLTPAEGEELTTTATGRLVFLPSPPVSDVTVTVDGDVVDVSVRADEGIVVLPSNRHGATVTVTYTSGPAAVPPAAKAVVLAVAARLMTNADGVTQKSIGDVSISYGRAQAGPGLTEWEASALGPLRFPSVQ